MAACWRILASGTAPGYRSGQDDALIARHLELAGDEVPAADRYMRAATHAMDLGGNADAFRQLSRALKLIPLADHERRFSAHGKREEILRRHVVLWAAVAVALLVLVVDPGLKARLAGGYGTPFGIDLWPLVSMSGRFFTRTVIGTGFLPAASLMAAGRR